MGAKNRGCRWTRKSDTIAVIDCVFVLYLIVFSVVGALFGV